MSAMARAISSVDSTADKSPPRFATTKSSLTHKAINMINNMVVIDPPFDESSGSLSAAAAAWFVYLLGWSLFNFGHSVPEVKSFWESRGAKSKRELSARLLRIIPAAVSKSNLHPSGQQTFAPVPRG